MFVSFLVSTQELISSFVDFKVCIECADWDLGRGESDTEESDAGSMVTFGAEGEGLKPPQ